MVFLVTDGFEFVAVVVVFVFVDYVVSVFND
jgi:hypothetical protein